MTDEKNIDIEQEQAETEVPEVDTAEVREKALSYLEHRTRSIMEVRIHLYEHGYPEPAIAEVVKDLTDEGLLDDLKYAKEYIEYAMSKKRGSIRIRYELHQKGVQRPSIEQAYRELEDEGKEIQKQEIRNAVNEAKVIVGDRKLDPMIINKVGAKLSRLGYSNYLINEILNGYFK